MSAFMARLVYILSEILPWLRNNLLQKVVVFIAYFSPHVSLVVELLTLPPFTAMTLIELGPMEAG